MTAERIFDHDRVWQLTPDVFAEMTDRLAEAASRLYGPIAAVVGIARGGVHPAKRMASVLSVPMFEVSARHNLTDALYAPATGEVVLDGVETLLRPEILGGTVLVVDDICGTGATLLVVLDAVARLAPGALVRTVTLCRNVGAQIEPDLCCWDVADWVVFPWEPTPDGYPLIPLPPPTGLRTRG